MDIEWVPAEKQTKWSKIEKHWYLIDKQWRPLPGGTLNLETLCDSTTEFKIQDLYR